MGCNLFQVKYQCSASAHIHSQLLIMLNLLAS